MAMNSQQPYWAKTWRLKSGDRLSDADAQYLIDCKLHVNTKRDVRSIQAGNSSYEYVQAFEVDVTTINNKEESAFLLRFAGRFVLLNICQINTAYHSFHYGS